VFLRHSQRQGSLPDTVIEFQVDGAWRAASAEPSAGVTAVRLGRFGHAALIAFDSPRRVCLSAEPFQVAFQAPVRLRMIKVDLLGGAPAPTALPEKLSVTYTIRAAP
jgi:hypothetical protein